MVDHGTLAWERIGARIAQIWLQDAAELPKCDCCLPDILEAVAKGFSRELLDRATRMSEAARRVDS